MQPLPFINFRTSNYRWSVEVTQVTADEALVAFIFRDSPRNLKTATRIFPDVIASSLEMLKAGCVRIITELDGELSPLQAIAESTAA